ncbi:MAG: hypothetical protein GDA36_08885 [Rhodobacteraceae bacterium]|nr:hypothetical protein [Paracoccaceae bacterium]
MLSGSFDLAILSGPLTLQQAKHRAKRFWWLGYAIARVCGVRVILFAAPRRFCPITTIARWAYVLASPNYRAVLHRGIGIAQPRKRRLDIRLPPRFSKARRGR